MSREEKRSKSRTAGASLTKKATKAKAASGGRATTVNATVPDAALIPANKKVDRGPAAGRAREPAKREPSVSTSASKTKAVAMAPEPVVELPELASAGSAEEIEMRIRRRAYELWVQRGHQHGYATEDWLQAEREVADSISKPAGSRPGKATRVQTRTKVK
jgi:hypothetical protein